MNKRTQIGLILVITLVLLLGLTIPSMAEKEPAASCYINPILLREDGGIARKPPLFGTLDAYWDEDTGVLVNLCTGTIPFDEQSTPLLTYADLEAYCEAEEGECNEAGTIYTISDEGNGKIYDPLAGVFYWADYRTFTLYDDGDFVFEKYYTP